MGLAQGDCGTYEWDGHPSAHTDVTDPELGEEATQTRAFRVICMARILSNFVCQGIQDMERRCKDVETAVLHNNEVIARQVAEIVRGFIVGRSVTNSPI